MYIYMYIYMPGGAMRRISSVGWNWGSSSAKANASCRLAFFFFGVISAIKALLMRC